MSLASGRMPDRADPVPSGRLDGIDTMRVVAILAVVTIHFPPLELFHHASDGLRLFFLFVHDACRFAVPFFFLAAGYFGGRRVARGDWGTRLLVTRIAYMMLLYVFWSIVYVLAWHNWGKELPLRPVGEILSSSLVGAWNESLRDPIRALMNGPTWHLWFLPALACGLGVVGLLQIWRKPRWIVPVGIVLYGIALVFGPYQRILGLPPIPATIRNGPFVSTLYVGLGWVWGLRPSWRPRLEIAALLIALGLPLHLAETWWLAGGRPTYHPEYVAATTLLGVGIFLLALALPGLGSGTPIPRMGRYTLGVYALHLIVGMLIRPAFRRLPDPSALAHVPVTYFITLAIVAALACVRPLKPLVM